MDVMNQQMSIILFFHFKTNKPVDRKNIIFDSNIFTYTVLYFRIHSSYSCQQALTSRNTVQFETPNQTEVYTNTCILCISY